ncbi:WD-40 repeat protein [Reticulomyxa filosa]|uniref:WD-40 repeat protein n=1 Tax=Reticulomyxa filosa TaxID=46433 RepID=X6N838_RETFI|nr:WD-40 repeat protein [Reticulomyxa filosa]|eukprot:ETO21894.1 WD-40 repeat protein [Reticulomyxa filosa]
MISFTVYYNACTVQSSSEAEYNFHFNNLFRTLSSEHCDGLYCEKDKLYGGMNTDSTAIQQNDKISLAEKEIDSILKTWVRFFSIDIGWINEFNKIIVRYAKYFKLLKFFLGHTDCVNSVQFSSDGSKIVSSSDDKTIRIYFEDTWIGSMMHNFSPDSSKIVLSSMDNTIRLWDTLGEELKNLEGHSSLVTDVQFSPDGQTIVSSSNDSIVIVWDVKSGERLCQLLGHSDIVSKAQFSPDGRYVVSCSHDKTIKIWSVASGKELKQLEGHSDLVNDVQYLPNGQIIVSCSWDGTIRFWDVKSSQEIQNLEGHTGCVTGVDVSPDGGIIGSSSYDHKIGLWG